MDNTNDINNISNIKNLINLSSLADINIFDKKMKIKNKDKLIKECEKIKRQQIKDTSLMLSNLAKLNQPSNNNVKNIFSNLENKIENIDKIISCINTIEPSTRLCTEEIKETKKNKKTDNKVNNVINFNETDFIQTNKNNNKNIELGKNKGKEKNIIRIINADTNIRPNEAKASLHIEDFVSTKPIEEQIEKLIEYKIEDKIEEKSLSDSIDDYDNYIECYSNY
jgi:hypothetical protein